MKTDVAFESCEDDDALHIAYAPMKPLFSEQRFKVFYSLTEELAAELPSKFSQHFLLSL